MNSTTPQATSCERKGGSAIEAIIEGGKGGFVSRDMGRGEVSGEKGRKIVVMVERPGWLDKPGSWGLLIHNHSSLYQWESGWVWRLLDVFPLAQFSEVQLIITNRQRAASLCLCFLLCICLSIIFITECLFPEKILLVSQPQGSLMWLDAGSVALALSQFMGLG